jgi:hypothetical protein
MLIGIEEEMTYGSQMARAHTHTHTHTHTLLPMLRSPATQLNSHIYIAFIQSTIIQQNRFTRRLVN